MSEALSSTEIEDVLSSIRRLVSDDLRPISRSGQGAQPAGSADKLMLTPALRVVADEPASADAPLVFVHRARSDVAGDPAGIEQVVASLGAAVGPQSTEWEAETGDSSVEFAEHQPGTDDWAVAEPEPMADAEIVAEYALPQNFVFSSTTVDEVIAAPVAEAIPGWAQEDGAVPADEDFSEPPEVLSNIEPDPVWADEAEASVIAALSSDGQDELADDPLLPEDDALLFNEEVLRELVRDILREELAGKMGERITRNIRKLVRAEIARSLAAQDFE